MVNRYQENPYIFLVINLTHLHRSGFSLSQLADIYSAHIMEGGHYGN